MNDSTSEQRCPSSKSMICKNNSAGIGFSRKREARERRDADFECKMAEVLVVYRDVSLNPPEAACDARTRPIHTVSVDEKAGVQALGTTALDLLPVLG
jgi:hypothetical protein